MSNLRDIAYQIDPALWVRDVLEMTPTPWQETFLRAPRGASILALTARQVRQDHHRGLGDCAFHGVFAAVAVGDRLPGAAPKCGGGAAGARGASSRQAPSSRATTSTRSSSRTAPGCWRCRAAMIRSAG